MPRKTRRRKAKKKEFQHRVRLLGIAVLASISSVVLYGGIHLYRFFADPLAKASSSLSSSSWDGEQPLNLVVFSLESDDDQQSLISNLGLLHISPQSEELSFVTLPVDFKAPLPAGLGENYLRALYALGNLGDSGGEELVCKGVSSLLAVPVESYLGVSRAGFSSLEGALRGESGLLAAGSTGQMLLNSGIKSNLSFWKIVQVLRSILAIKPNDRHFFEAPLEDILYLDDLVKKYVSDPKVVEERPEVLVLNGTRVSGLALVASRFVENLGADILNVANAPTQEYKLSILVAPEETYTVKRLAETLRVLDFRSLDALGNDPLLNHFQRADIVIILGQDFVDSF